MKPITSSPIVEFIILFLLSVVLIIASIIVIKQTLKIRRLKKLGKVIDLDIRDRKQHTWPADEFHTNNKK